MSYDPFDDIEPPEVDVTVPLDDEGTAKIQAGPVTINLDLNQLLKSTVWGNGEMETAADAIVTAAAHLMVGKLEKGLTAEIIETAKVTIEARVNHIVEDALTAEVVETDAWGGRKAPVTLTERIREEVKKATTWGRGGPYASDKSPIQKYVEGEVLRQVKTDVDGAIKEVREAADKAVRTETANIVSTAIDRAKARF